jgi:hypothetical protein
MGVRVPLLVFLCRRVKDVWNKYDDFPSRALRLISAEATVGCATLLSAINVRTIFPIGPQGRQKNISLISPAFTEHYTIAPLFSFAVVASRP